eukprot:scaffold658_cov56-Attheya_sp.AAC.1
MVAARIIIADRPRSIPYKRRRTATTTVSTVLFWEEESEKEEEEEEPHDENAPAQIHEGPDGEAKLRAKYEVCEVIGVGSTSTVHRCVDRKTGVDFACKIIDKKHMEQRFQGMVDQFHTEIQALQSLRHPHIIALYDVYITDEKIYIVMERMEGGELFDYVVQRGTLNEEEASRIVRQVTSALVYVHSMNFLHRDLKPENLLLRQKPLNPKDIEVKIIDFGLSKFMEEPVASSFLGTRGYLAPEMLQRKKYTSAVDAWALGVIVFVLLCGCLPFDDDSQSIPSDALMRSKFILRFPRWARDLSPSAKDLLSHLLDVNAMTRYTTEQALQHPWVSGEEAPRRSLLQSPGRIKQSQSPYLLNNGSATRTAVKDHVSTMHATRARDAAAAAAGPKRPVRQHVRKTSI